jgi:hypothetical protein
MTALVSGATFPTRAILAIVFRPPSISESPASFPRTRTFAPHAA